MAFMKHESKLLIESKVAIIVRSPQQLKRHMLWAHIKHIWIHHISTSKGCLFSKVSQIHLQE